MENPDFNLPSLYVTPLVGVTPFEFHQIFGARKLNSRDYHDYRSDMDHTVLPANYTMPAFTPQPQNITALWLVLILPSHEG